ncbi:MAG: methyltransferase domain-containing protein [Desulfobacterales bacterium]|nr:MAG: methyltransferase domain-containing protein [Desulfobacterales bacterium]
MAFRKASFSKNGHVCPWWLAYTFDNPIRKLFHQPQKMLGPYIREGMTVMDVGCGMGFFSIGMAKMAGDNGKVIAVDRQQKMLDIMLKRAKRAGIAERISAHHCEPDKIGILEKVGFILTFWMVHEVGNQKDFFSQLGSILASGGKILMAEPKMHVCAEDFQKTIAIARATGLRLSGQPAVRFSHSALFEINE